MRLDFMGCQDVWQAAYRRLRMARTLGCSRETQAAYQRLMDSADVISSEINRNWLRNRKANRKTA